MTELAELVERLKPRYVVDAGLQVIVQALREHGCEAEAFTLNEWIVANNAIKSEAVAAIERLEREVAGLVSVIDEHAPNKPLIASIIMASIENKVNAEAAESRALTAEAEVERLEREAAENAIANSRLAEQMERTLAELEKVREALRQARIWHESEDKALSKQPPSHGPNGNQWARLQHQEQMAEIDAALSEPDKEGML